MTLDFVKLKPIQSLVTSLFFQKRNLLVMLPRQEGKTELGVRLIHSLLSNNSKSRSALFLAKSKSAGVKATREKFSRVFDDKTFTVNTAQVYNKKHPSLVCYMDSVDKQPARLRGGTYKLIHWSEVAFSEFDHGVNVEHVLNTCIRPTMRAVDGLAYLESTPNGKNGWADLWDNAASLGFSTFKCPLSQLVEMNLSSREEFERLQSTMPRLEFLQEYECQFVSFQGIAYEELQSHHVWERMPSPSPSHTVFSGIDWGWDPSATCVLFSYISQGRICVFDEIYSKKMTNAELAKAINEKMHVYDIRKFMAFGDHDPKSIDELQRFGIPIEPADKTNTLGQRMDIKTLFKQDKLYIHPRCVFTLKDMQTAPWNPKVHGDIDYKKCGWGHFDAEAAMRYMIRSVLYNTGINASEQTQTALHWAKQR